MKFFRYRRRMLLLLAAVMLGLYIVRPGANGFRRRISRSIELALGRRVEIGWVKARILPQPGFDLENFVVYDDPAYGAEPMLRAPEVTAVLRLRSLLHGRLEIRRLSLKEPSFNLVRGDDGHWNLEQLLDRAAHTPAAPTGNTKPEARPVFPYIEADNGRINFKIGQEKKAYALTDADFALWLESDTQWGTRLQAQPVRTDFNLSDTGILRVTGTWQRSASLRETPLQFNLQWDRAQLGQLTKLIYGSDKGWRGGLTLTSTASGTPADLTIHTQASVQDFRRYDIVSPDSLRLSATCSAHYSSIEHALSGVLCRAPVGSGVVTLGGRINSPTGPRSYDLDLVADDLPIQGLVRLARHAKKNLPEDLVANGTVSAKFSARTLAPGQPGVEWAGSGETAEGRIRSGVTRGELNLGRIPFAIGPGSSNPEKRNKKDPVTPSAEPRLEIRPFTVALGKSSVATVHGWIGRAGYNLIVQGNAQVQRALQVAELFGLRAPEPAALGAAKLDLQIAGGWAGFAAPRVTGTAQLRGVRAEVRGLYGPIEIDSADLVLSETTAEFQNLAASSAGSHWTGGLSVPRSCSTTVPCPAGFDLHADNIASSELHDLLSPHAVDRPWYRFLSSAKQVGPPLLTTLTASGKVSADRISIRGVVATHVSAMLELDEGRVRVSSLTGDLLGGKHRGEWEADLRIKPPAMSGNGAFERVSLAQLATAMHDGWISGACNGLYTFSTFGKTPAEMLENAAGTLMFDVRGGVLPHLELTSDSGPVRIHHFAGRVAMRDSKFEIEEGKLETPSGIYQLSGTASSGRKLNVKLTRSGGRGFNVTGTLEAPRVQQAAASETQAALKP